MDDRNAVDKGCWAMEGKTTAALNAKGDADAAERELTSVVILAVDQNVFAKKEGKWWMEKIADRWSVVGLLEEKLQSKCRAPSKDSGDSTPTVLMR